MLFVDKRVDNLVMLRSLVGYSVVKTWTSGHIAYKMPCPEGVKCLMPRAFYMP